MNNFFVTIINWRPEGLIRTCSSALDSQFIVFPIPDSEFFWNIGQGFAFFGFGDIAVQILVFQNGELQRNLNGYQRGENQTGYRIG
jgi:hypothetical protein